MHITGHMVHLNPSQPVCIPHNRVRWSTLVNGFKVTHFALPPSPPGGTSGTRAHAIDGGQWGNSKIFEPVSPGDQELRAASFPPYPGLPMGPAVAPQPSVSEPHRYGSDLALISQLLGYPWDQPQPHSPRASQPYHCLRGELTGSVVAGSIKIYHGVCPKAVVQYCCTTNLVPLSIARVCRVMHAITHTALNLISIGKLC